MTASSDLAMILQRMDEQADKGVAVLDPKILEIECIVRRLQTSHSGIISVKHRLSGEHQLGALAPGAGSR